MTKLSVIIPAFNAARTISQTLKSLQAQTLTDWDAIVVDDGSTDTTYSIARAFGERDPRIWAIQIEDRGKHTDCQGRARAANVAIDRASGQYVAFLDADDLWLSDFAEKCVAALDADIMAPGVYTDFIEWREHAGTEKVHRCPPFDRKLLLSQNFVAISFTVFRFVARFDPDWEPVADWDVHVRATKRRPYIHANEVLAVRRLHSTQATARVSPRYLAKALLLPWKYAGVSSALRSNALRLWGLTRRALHGT